MSMADVRPDYVIELELSLKALRAAISRCSRNGYRVTLYGPGDQKCGEPCSARVEEIQQQPVFYVVGGLKQ